MAKYHVNPTTGRPNICTAKTPEKCLYYDTETSTEAPHFTDKISARKHIEETLAKEYNNKPITKQNIFKKQLFLNPITVKPTNPPNFYELGYDEESISYLGSFYNGEIPERTLPEILGKMPFKDYFDYDRETRLRIIAAHDYIQEAGAYANINKIVAKEIAKNLPKNAVILDPTAGKGFVAKAMREQGIPTIATDNNSWNISKNIEQLDALDAIEKYGANATHVMMSWLPYENNLDIKIIKKIKEKHPHLAIIWIGEGPGGCCGSDEFWNHYQEKVSIQSYKPFGHLNDFASIGEIR